MVCAIICEGEAKAALLIQLIDAMHQMMEAEDIVELDYTCAKLHKDTVAACRIVSASYHSPIDAPYDDDIKMAEELETYKEGAGSSMNVLARTMAALKLDKWWGARLQAYKEALPQIIAHGASFETNKIALEKLCAGALPPDDAASTLSEAVRHLTALSAVLPDAALDGSRGMIQKALEKHASAIINADEPSGRDMQPLGRLLSDASLLFPLDEGLNSLVMAHGTRLQSVAYGANIADVLQAGSDFIKCAVASFDNI